MFGVGKPTHPAGPGALCREGSRFPTENVNPPAAMADPELQGPLRQPPFPHQTCACTSLAERLQAGVRANAVWSSIISHRVIRLAREGQGPDGGCCSGPWSFCGLSMGGRNSVVRPCYLLPPTPILDQLGSAPFHSL